MDGQQLHDATDRDEMLRVLIRQHGDAIVQYCRARLGDGLAEEVAQEVFVAIWQKLPAKRPSGPQDPLTELLFGIARNKCKQAYRNWARRRAIRQAFTEEIRQRAHAAGPTTPRNGETQVALSTRLHTCLGKLRDTDRILLTLWYWKEIPVAEIADIMSKSEAAIRRQLTRAQQRLKEIMRATPEE